MVKACLPGCENLEATGENGFRAVVKLKIGAISARLKGLVELSEIGPPNGYRMSGEGEVALPASQREARVSGQR
jgi:uncharacterized protein